MKKMKMPKIKAVKVTIKPLKMKKPTKPKPSKPKPVKHAKEKNKMDKVMDEYKHHELHSGSKNGPEVKSRKQAIAIGLSEARKAGARIPKKRK